MRGSQKSTLGALIIFMLIAVVAIGGMTWATQSSFALAKKTINDDYDGVVEKAMWRMDGYMSNILYSEGQRDYADYKTTKTVTPLAVWSGGEIEFNTDKVEIPTDIAVHKPPRDWIDLYFQVDATQRITSPQIDDDSTIWMMAGKRELSAWPRAIETWDWLRSRLTEIDVRACVAAVYQSLPEQYKNNLNPEESEAERARHIRLDKNDILQRGNDEYKLRKKTLSDSQIKHLPPAACEEIDITDNKEELTSVPVFRGFNPGNQQVGVGGITINIDPIVAFWIGKNQYGQEKLAFVRECHADADVFYQGFIGDWNLLKPELLNFFADLNLDAELVPLINSQNADPVPGKFLMSTLPVRLQVAGIAGGATLAAWQKTKWTLITMWVATAAVLLIAGWGLRNLVSLTERRMQFAYAVTHELRTPLTTFRLYSDMLAANLVPEESKQEYLDTLNRESARLSSLVEGVLEYARLENHRVRLNPVSTDGSALMDSIAETLHKRCEAYGVKPVEENLITNGLALHTDVDVVQRIAGVLVNNACRHARETEDAKVLVRLSAENDQIHLDIIDTGHGIERRDVRKIFKPFRRGQRADSSAQGGIGLGLALARNWAKLLGGKLELASRHHIKMGGAHFRLTLPIRM